MPERATVSLILAQVGPPGGSVPGREPPDPSRLAPYRERFKAEIERFGGGFGGTDDRIGAVFGLREPGKDHAVQAITAARAMQAATAELNRRLDDKLLLRAVVDTGEVLVETHLDGEREEGTAVGGLVGLLSTVIEHLRSSGVMVGEGTHAATTDVFDYEELAPVGVEGVGKPVKLWRVQGRRSVLPFEGREPVPLPAVPRASRAEASPPPTPPPTPAPVVPAVTAPPAAQVKPSAPVTPAPARVTPPARVTRPVPVTPPPAPVTPAAEASPAAAPTTPPTRPLPDTRPVGTKEPLGPLPDWPAGAEPIPKLEPLPIEDAEDRAADRRARKHQAPVPPKPTRESKRAHKRANKYLRNLGRFVERGGRK